MSQRKMGDARQGVDNLQSCPTLLELDAAHFEGPDDGGFDQVVWAGGAGGDADDDGFVLKQEVGVVTLDFLFVLEVVV